MPENPRRHATGFQIAFLIFALLLLSAPADKYLYDKWQWAKDIGFPIGRAMMLLTAGAILFGVPPLRRICTRLLSIPIPATKRKELSAVIVLDVMTGFGAIGAFALWFWCTGGDLSLAKHMGHPLPRDVQWGRYVSVYGVATSLFLGGLVAPIVEELVFRGMLYRAWEAQWGWIPAALATSATFAIFHPNVLSQFMGSLVFICIYRRTGSLRACIVIHSLSNILNWYPLLGQFLFPRAETGDLRYFTFHLVCLVVVFFAIPIYMWMSRDSAVPSQSSAVEALPQRA